MRGSFSVTSPGDVEFTLTLTASMADWAELRATLEHTDGPAWHLDRLIDDVLTQANSSFDPRPELG